MPGESLNRKIHQDKALEKLSVAYKPGKFIASQLSPDVPVIHESDKYYVYDKDSFRLDETLRANGAVANESSLDLSTASYRLTEHALKAIITDRDRDNADKAIKLEADHVENLTDKLLLRQEYDLATIVNNKALFDNKHDGGNWGSNTTTTNPIIDVYTATAAIENKVGLTPNVCVINNTSLYHVKNHVSIIDRLKYTSSESVSEGLIARLFGIDKLLVGAGIRNTASEGLANTMSLIWTDSAFIAYIAPAPGLKKPSALYTFRSMKKGSPYVVKRYRDEERESDVIEVGTMYQHKIVASDCAYVIYAVQS